jgi:hypothetical protein
MPNLLQEMVVGPVRGSNKVGLSATRDDGKIYPGGSGLVCEHRRTVVLEDAGLRCPLARMD